MAHWVGNDLSISSNGFAIFIGILMSMSWFSIKQVNASIHEYKNEAFIRRSNSYFFHGSSEELYASKIPVTRSSQEDNILNGKSFIRTKASAAKRDEMQQNTGLIEALIVEVKERDKIRGSHLNSSAICCTPDLAKGGSCNVVEVIIHQEPSKPDGPKRLQTFFEGKNEEAKMVLQTIEINSTGMYYLYFMFCDPELKGTVVSGRTVWRNPDSYLPGKMAPMMTLYGLMSLAYLTFGVVWFLWFVEYWKDVTQLHYHITALLGLGMGEMALWYFEYVNFDSNGSRPMGITLWAVTVRTCKKTVSRLLLLVFSMRYEVLCPTLYGMASKVLLLGVTYFVASEALGLVENLENINDFSGKARLLLVLPVALLDACFVIWIFSSLSQTLEKLKVRRSAAKFALYRKFTNFLAVAVLLSIAWIGYELYFNATDPLSEMWRTAWIIPAFWTLLDFVLLVVACLLWAPSLNPTRCMFSEDDYDGKILLSGGEVKVAGDLSTKLERKEKKATSAAEHYAHGFGESVEEERQLLLASLSVKLLSVNEEQKYIIFCSAI